MSTKAITITIIIIIVAALLTALAITVVIPAIKRKKLAQAWSDVAKKASLTLTPAYIQNELKKVSNKEVDTLITFSQDLQAKKYSQAITMLGDIDKILQKTSLGSINTYLTAFIGGTPKA
jgi:lipopolysaccharide export LptBFGC system permease protein LptF